MATEPFIRPLNRPSLAFTVLVLSSAVIMGTAWAKSAPVVTEADIERARREQPNITDQDMERILSVNLMATMALTQEAAKTMVQSGSGSIVIVSSINEDRVIPEQAHYCASKGGLRQWGRALAAALGPNGVRVNMLCPGAIDTPMNQPYLAAHPERRETVLNRTPLRRLGDPTDIASAAAFLASDESRFMTGASLVVDGGLSLG